MQVLTVISFVIITLLVFADQCIKNIVVTHMELNGDPIGFIDGVVQ